MNYQFQPGELVRFKKKQQDNNFEFHAGKVVRVLEIQSRHYLDERLLVLMPDKRQLAYFPWRFEPVDEKKNWFHSEPL